MKSPKTSEFLTDEVSAIERAALAQLAILEGASVFAVVVEQLELGDTVDAAFKKNLKRCINACASAVPNQYKHKVLEYMLSTEEEKDDAPAPTGEVEAGVHAVTTEPPTE